MSVKTGAERSIEALTWAAVVIWLGFTLIMNLLHYYWLIVMVLGIILLSSAIYQRSRGWHTSLSIWIFGIWMAVFSVLNLVNSIVGPMYEGAGQLWVQLGVALISMGVAVVLRSVNAPALSARSRASTARDSAIRTEGDVRSHIPRRVEDDFSSAYYPSPSEEAGAVADTAYTRPTDSYTYDEAPTIVTGYEAAVPRQPTPVPSAQPRQPTPVPRVPRQPTPLPGADPRTAPASPPYQSGPVRYETLPLDQQPAPTGYETRRLDDEGYTYDSPQPRTATQDYPPALGEVRRPASRRAARRRSATAAPEPDDLQARVDDIIRRSQERRSAAPDERLPY